MTVPPADHYAFEIKFRVNPESIDDLNHVNNVVYLQWVQDAAEAHWKSVSDEVLRKTCTWVVLKHEINYHAPAFAFDEIIASTWVEEPEGPKQIRHVSIRRVADGKVLALAKTTWCLLDPLTGRPKRISAEISGILGLKN